MTHTVSDSRAAAEALYLDLLKRCLTRSVFEEGYQAVEPPVGRFERLLFAWIGRWLAARGWNVVHPAPFDPDLRAEGRDWPLEAETMIGLHRLDNLQQCVTDLIRRQVPGDLIETGVWRGGAAIFMRAILKVYGETGRIVWAADSFQGLPRPDAVRYPADAGDRHWTEPRLAVSLEVVKANFARYGLLDAQVRFLVGWFSDTLPTAPVDRLALLRLDGDMYGSTMDGLRYLYPKVSVGGYVVVDDYGAVPGCRAAVDNFRAEHGIREELEWIDWTGVFWRRLR